MKSEEVGIIAVAGGGEDVVSDDVADGSPGENVNDVETDGVVGFEEADVLLSPRIAGLEVGQSVLLGDLLGHVLPLEIEEDEAAEEEG